MDYFQVSFDIVGERAEHLTAWLGTLPFDTFEEGEAALFAYIPAEAWTPDVQAETEALASDFGCACHATFMPAQNWNAVWEAAFEPIVLEGVVQVRAEFHAPAPDVPYDIVIQPRMAFGTGHHATTAMMMAWMAEAGGFSGQHLLDYGCGTGILAIFAALLGAGRVEAVDIERDAYENTLDNAVRNACPAVLAHHGTLGAVPQVPYDGILANINRNVLLDSLPHLAQLCKPAAPLWLSGFLLEDEAMMCAAASAAGFVASGRRESGKWLSLRFLRGA